jgi:chemosensory pili system protein ChpA (sensor histidine kinase/response regulator)
MNSAPFDQKVLAAVKPGLSAAFTEIAANIERFFEAPENNTATLAAARGQLRGLLGVLKMAGLDGLAVFCTELELVLGELSGHPQTANAASHNVVKHALHGVTQYLDALANGADNATLRLFAQYRDMQQLRGLEMSFKLDLFYPDVHLAPPQPILAIPLRADAAAHLKSLRAQYQQALLRWLRSDAAAIQQMQQAAIGAINCTPQNTGRAFWWVAHAMFECVKANDIPEEVNIRKLLGRIDQHMRALVEGKEDETQPLMNEMLYIIGCCQIETEPTTAIKRWYALPCYLPSQQGLSLEQIEQVRAALREQLRGTQENWERCVQGDDVSCGKFSGLVEQIVSESDKLEDKTLQSFARQVQQQASAVTSSEQARQIAIDMAMALLLLENGIENYSNPGEIFRDQAQILVDRMQDAIAQQPENLEKFSRLVDLHYQGSESRFTVPLANEMLANLQRIEQGLNAFFNEQIQPAELGGLLRMLSQINGGLNMLSLQPAAALLATVRDKVRQFSQGEDRPSVDKVGVLAETMGRLENYLQYFAHGQVPDEALLQSVAPGGGEESAPEGGVPAVEAAKPAEPAVTMEFVAPAAPQGEPVQFTTAEALPAEVPEVMQAAQQQAEPIPEQAEATEEPVPAAPAEAAVQMEHPIIEDQELLDIFLEESREVLASIRDNLEICRLRPVDNVALSTVRRGFHTLKGSGRMVGLNNLGEAAWGVERALNSWLQNTRPITPGLLDFIGMAAQAFAGWVEELARQGGVRIEASQLMAVAQQIEQGLDGAVQAMEGAAAPAVPAAPEPAASEQKLPPVLEIIPTLPSLTFDVEPIAATATEQPAFAEPPANLESLASVEPVAPSLAEQSGIAEAEETVAIGDLRVPVGLFGIASAESMENVTHLQEQLDRLRTATPPLVQYDFMRAAHTLVGLNQAMGFSAAVDLAHTLESWLRAHLDPPVAASEQQQGLLDEVVSALGDMVLNICSMEPPVARQDLVVRLVSDMRKATVQDAVAEAEKKVAAAVQQPAPVQQAEVAATKQAELKEEVEKPEVRDEIDEQLLPLFLEEAEELCAKVNEGLRLGRGQPQDAVNLQSLKRHIHTMKGSSRMAGAMRIGEIAHGMEDRVATAAGHSHEPGFWDDLESDFDNIIALLEELRGGKPAEIARKPSEVVPIAATQQVVQIAAEQPVERRLPEQAAERATLGSNVLRVRADLVDHLVNEAGEISVARSRIETELHTFKDNLEELTSSVTRLRQQLREVEIQAEGQMQARVSQAKDNAGQFDPLEFDRFTRLQELTRFMNESVHDVQTVQQILLKKLEDATLVMQGQARTNRELQQHLMSIRMVAFNSIADRLYRIVRQTGKELNKRANLELQGVNVELDRSVLEKMVAPFEHLLRNAIVHGLEDSEQRAQAGKNPIGEISLSVRQENNEVVFEFSDDGAGLNYNALRTKAIAGGLLRADEEVSDDQLAQLIFTSGLSTAKTVTEVAGRGVGMDVVRSEITGLGGRIDVSSKRGQGTRFTIYLPLTLAVTQIVLVRSGEHNYAIPAAMVEQVRQVKSSDMDALHLAQKVEWQGHSYPLFYLSQLLNDGEFSQENQPRNPLLLLRSGDQRYALHVDELLGNQEAVVKNIGPQLARHSGISGATVLGNGTVVMILNPVQLAQRISSSNRTNKILATKQLDIRPLIMVVDDSLTVRKITSRMLTRAGYQVVTATDGVDALEQLEEFTPDVMLLDIEMPRMDGFTLAKELRRSPNTKSMPIIMITSRTADKHRDYAMQLGVNTYLGKPYQEDELLQNIADFVAGHK